MEKKNLDWANIGFEYVQTDKRYVANYKDGNTLVARFLCQQSCHRAIHSAAHCDNCFFHFYSILFCDPITRNIIVYNNFIYRCQGQKVFCP